MLIRYLKIEVKLKEWSVLSVPSNGWEIAFGYVSCQPCYRNVVVWMWNDGGGMKLNNIFSHLSAKYNMHKSIWVVCQCVCLWQCGVIVLFMLLQLYNTLLQTTEHAPQSHYSHTTKTLKSNAWQAAANWQTHNKHTCSKSRPLELSLGTTCCQVVDTWYKGNTCWYKIQ